MRHSIMIDFGSTFTKVAVADLTKKELLLSDKFPSTVHTDARIAMEQCFDAAAKVLTEKEISQALKLSSSSAAGGLRMAVVGLTRSLSATAGSDAVFGAGAKVMGTFYGTLDEKMIGEIEQLPLEIILFCGGYENGNRSTVLHNARMLAASHISAPVVFSGNRQVDREVRLMFKETGKECFVIDNILPDIGVLNVEPSQQIIRDLFMKRITNMKGLAGVKKTLGEILMPTPAAVLRAGELLSRGTDKSDGLGDMMMIDVGGATTDVYSFNVNTAYEGATLAGTPEPFAKRMVEGDMGMRESSVCLFNEVPCADLAAEAGVSEQAFKDAIDLRTGTTSFVADSETERDIDDTIAANAVRISARRHAGKLEYSFHGNVERLQRGKNLTEIQTVIGTGGPIVNSRDPKKLLSEVCMKSSDVDILLPESVECYIDRDYVFYAAGLLCDYDEEAALALMKNSLKLV